MAVKKYLDETGLGTLVTNIKTYVANNKTTFTGAQQNALDSGITSHLVGQITTNKNNITNLETTIKTGVTFKGKVTEFPANPQNG